MKSILVRALPFALALLMPAAALAEGDVGKAGPADHPAHTAKSPAKTKAKAKAKTKAKAKAKPAKAHKPSKTRPPKKAPAVKG